MNRTLLTVVTAAAVAPAVAGAIAHASHSQFELYAKLDKHRQTASLAAAAAPSFAALAHLPYAHSYFEFLRTGGQTLLPGDTPTCC